MRTAALFFFAILLGTAAATEGGNISVVNISGSTNSTWHAVCGQSTPSTAVPVIINATPGGITRLVINTGSSDCRRGPGYINLIFSNSSQNITSLVRGNLTLLDQFINHPGQNSSETFVFSTAFPTRGWGVVTAVPTTYTKSPNPSAFRMGYLNDQSKNILIIARVNNNQTGFNGSAFDFQLMLPTRNGTNTSYYLTVDFACNAPPTSGGSGGGGGSGIPINMSVPETEAIPPQPPPLPPPRQPPSAIPPANITCTPDIVCGEWGPCLDNSSIQRCEDRNKCSGRELFNVRKCEPRIEPQGVSPPKEAGPQGGSVFELIFPAALIIMVISLIMLLYRWRRNI
ncbi:MAG: hypothetical protein U0R44_04600 [Candidatus Micrarchaeia archaeon]